METEEELDFFEELANALWSWRVDVSGDKEDLWLKKHDIILQIGKHLEPVVNLLEWKKSHDYAKGFRDKFSELYDEVYSFYDELEQGELDEEEIFHERIPILEDEAKQLAKHVLVVKCLCKTQAEIDYKLAVENRKEQTQTEQDDGSTNEELYAEINFAKRQIIIGSKTYKPTAPSIWLFLEELVRNDEQGRIMPKEEDEHNWKNAVDTLRRKKGGISMSNLKRIVQTHKPNGYSLAGGVRIRWW